MKTITLWELLDLGCSLKIIKDIMDLYNKKELDNDDIDLLILLCNVYIKISIKDCVDVLSCVVKKYKNDNFLILHEMCSNDLSKKKYMDYLKFHERDIGEIDSYWRNFYDKYAEGLKKGDFSWLDIGEIHNKIFKINNDNFKKTIYVLLSLDIKEFYYFFPCGSIIYFIQKYFKD